MNAALIAAIASTLAVVVTSVGILLNRRDRANEWRREVIIPSVQRFLAAADEADRMAAAYWLAKLMGKEEEFPDLRGDMVTAMASPMREASNARADLELFAPELDTLAARIMSMLVESQIGVNPPETQIVDALEGGFVRVQRPVFIQCRELARQARLLSRIEHRTPGKWFAERFKRPSPPTAL